VRCRPRVLLLISSVTGITLLLASRAALLRSTAPTPPACLARFEGACLVQHIPGRYPHGELGFRFGRPADVNGDRIPDIAAGSRFADLSRTAMGNVTVWSTSDRARLGHWNGQSQGGLFGHAALILGDLNGDGLSDVVASAPHGSQAASAGEVVALRPRDGRVLWRQYRSSAETFGWHLEPAGDLDADDVPDLFVGAPGARRVYLLSGRTGEELRHYEGEPDEVSFGWYVSKVPDLDGDGRPELVVGVPEFASVLGPAVGRAVLISGSGQRLHTWQGQEPLGMLGEVVAALGQGGGTRIAVSVTHLWDRSKDHPGTVQLYSAISGRWLRSFVGAQPHELYGRMIADIGDWDGDGEDDWTVSAPWYRNGNLGRAGRNEVRSGRTDVVLARVFGNRADTWLGWHIVPGASGIAPGQGLGLWSSALMQDGANNASEGRLEFYLPAVSPDHSREANSSYRP
jgi:hypothetical protein